MILAGAAGGALLLTGRKGGAAPAPEAARKMKMDLNCGAIGVRADIWKALDYAHRHGFEAFDPSGQEIARMPDGDRQKLLSEMKSRKVVFGAAGLPVNFRGGEERFKKDLERLPDLAAALQKAGVTRISTWISPGHNSLTYMQNFQVHAARLRQVAAVLDDHGLRFGLEYVGPKTSWSRSRFPFIHTLAEMRDLLEAMGKKNTGVVLDSWHWYTARETGADLLTLKNRDVVAVDLNDAPAGKDVDEQIDSRRELPCATGVIDVAAFLNALNTIGYDGPVRAEPFNAELRKMPGEEAVATTARAMKKAFGLIR